MKQEMYLDKIDITNRPRRMWVHVNPGKPDLLVGNVLQQYYNFSLFALCLCLTIINCRASGLSQIQLQKFQEQYYKISKSVVVQHKIRAP